MHIDFIEALSTDNMPAIKKAPKADLHCHAFFSTRLENVERWLGHPLTKPPLKMAGLEGMMEYADKILAPHIKHQQGFEFVAVSAVNDAMQDNVVRLEMSFDIRLAGFYSGGLAELRAFIQMLVEQFRPHIALHPELGFSRGDAYNPKLIKLAHEALESGLFQSIDLYSRQELCPPEVMKPLYTKARTAGMKLKAHVGEFGGAEEIRRTVEVLELDEVQHGIGAAESIEVMQWLAKHQIQLNVCPTSNVMLDAVSELVSHPIRILFHNGVPVTVNTDDLMIFGQSVSEEYRNLYQAGVFSAEELETIRQRSLLTCK